MEWRESLVDHLLFDEQKRYRFRAVINKYDLFASIWDDRRLTFVPVPHKLTDLEEVKAYLTALVRLS